MSGSAKTSVHPKIATMISRPAYTRSGRAVRNFQRAAIALPAARPAMKLDKISAADQTEFPKARPLRRSQSVSNKSALHPERKRITETKATGTAQDSTRPRQRSTLNRAGLRRLGNESRDGADRSRRALPGRVGGGADRSRMSMPPGRPAFRDHSDPRDSGPLLAEVFAHRLSIWSKARELLRSTRRSPRTRRLRIPGVGSSRSGTDFPVRSR